MSEPAPAGCEPARRRGVGLIQVSRALEAALAQPEDTMFCRMVRGFSGTVGTSPSSRWISRRSFRMRWVVDVQNTPKDTLYDWLAIMFKFCWATPFAYHSLYVPSPKIHRLAWQHKVKVVISASAVAQQTSDATRDLPILQSYPQPVGNYSAVALTALQRGLVDSCTTVAISLEGVDRSCSNHRRDGD